jgi:hypothetical protein
MNFQIGDMLVRRIKGPIDGKHYGIYLGAWGTFPDGVFHNCKTRGCQIVPFRQFAAGKVVNVAAPGTADSRLQRDIVSRAENLIGRMYHIIDFNCETAANYVREGVSFSQSVCTIARFLENIGWRIIPFNSSEKRDEAVPSPKSALSSGAGY